MNSKLINLKQIAISAMVVLLVSGCASVGPNYERPIVPVPQKWQSPLAGSKTASGIDHITLAQWWRSFDDPVLSELIERALVNNKDLKQAEARLREARARRGFAKADQFPSVGASAAANRTGSSQEASTGQVFNQFNTGFDAGWEIDLFGGKRRALEAADAQVEASESDLAAVQTSLTAEVGVNYLNYRAFEARLAVAEANLDIQRQTRDLAQWRYQAGLTSELDTEQAASALEQTRAQIPVLKTNLAQAKNQIAILLGINPQALPLFAPISIVKAPTPLYSVPRAKGVLAAGVPAEVLRNRPDIRRAERQLAAQTAQVGVATAAQYPNFSLTGSIGLASLVAGDLFTAAARTFSLGSNAGWTLFDAGRAKQNIEIQDALLAQALAKYESTVLAAFAEVENGLTAYAQEQERRDALIKAVAAAKRAQILASSQYSAGLIDFQSVLDTQRSLLTLQDLLVSSEAAVNTSLIQLYKALGGGWSVDSTPTKRATFKEMTR